MKSKSVAVTTLLVAMSIAFFFTCSVNDMGISAPNLAYVSIINDIGFNAEGFWIDSQRITTETRVDSGLHVIRISYPEDFLTLWDTVHVARKDSFQIAASCLKHCFQKPQVSFINPQIGQVSAYRPFLCDSTYYPSNRYDASRYFIMKVLSVSFDTVAVLLYDSWKIGKQDTIKMLRSGTGLKPIGENFLFLGAIFFENGLLQQNSQREIFLTDNIPVLPRQVYDSTGELSITKIDGFCNNLKLADTIYSRAYLLINNTPHEMESWASYLALSSNCELLQYVEYDCVDSPLWGCCGGIPNSGLERFRYLPRY